MNLYQVASVHIISILPPNSYDSIFKGLNSFKNLDIQANLFSTGHPTITVIFKLEVAHVHKWARGAMDNASDYGSEDSRFESWRARNILTLAQICPNNTLARVPAPALVQSLGKPGSATTGTSDLIIEIVLNHFCKSVEPIEAQKTLGSENTTVCRKGSFVQGERKSYVIAKVFCVTRSH